MKHWITFLLLINLSFLFALPRGTTQAELPSGFGVYDQAEELDLNLYQQIKSAKKTALNSRDWILADSLRLNTILPAGAQIGAKYYNPTRAFLPFASDGTLIQEAKAAIAKAPRWLESELTNVLRRLSPANQLRWANVINAAVDPYIDEIAFAIAHSSHAFLQYEHANPQLVVENAEWIYAVDNELSYVEVINVGSSTSDENYYSHTRYWKRNASGVLVQVDVPKEIYYWYIVHPKLTDEIPAYIDPAIVENNSTHNNNIALPPTGKFWRSFLYEVQEENYPVLRDTLMQINSLFNTGGSTDDAIRAITWWVNQTMSFTSNNERPHQPVRIYRKHFGRCGEYADYTSAVARTALIPCTSILSMSGDHTWNEFWDEDWIQWEPVNGYLNVPLVYENGWGKVFGSVFEIRPNGYLNPVTQRYSEGSATIVLRVVDVNGVPLDGARVVLALFNAGYIVDMVGFTDNDGFVILTVGESHNYYARVETPIGIHPPIAGTYTQLVNAAVDGQTYNLQISLEASKTLPEVSVLGMPPDEVEDYQIAITYSVPSYYISGRSTWDDIGSSGTYGNFYHEVPENGEVALLLTDSDNVIFYQDMNVCEAFAYHTPSQSGSLLFEIPVGQDYYLFADNKAHLGNAQKLDSVLYYHRNSVSSDDPSLLPQAIRLLPNFPNPFNPSTTITFELTKRTAARLDILNLRGQIVKTLQNEHSEAGRYQRTWDGTDLHGKDLAAGIYLYRLQTDNGAQVRKCILLK